MSIPFLLFTALIVSDPSRGEVGVRLAMTTADGGGSFLEGSEISSVVTDDDDAHNAFCHLADLLDTFDLSRQLSPSYDASGPAPKVVPPKAEGAEVPGTLVTLELGREDGRLYLVGTIDGEAKRGHIRLSGSPKIVAEGVGVFLRLNAQSVLEAAVLECLASVDARIDAETAELLTTPKAAPVVDAAPVENQAVPEAAPVVEAAPVENQAVPEAAPVVEAAPVEAEAEGSHLDPAIARDEYGNPIGFV